MTLSDCLIEARYRLTESGNPNPALEARILVQHAFAVDATMLIAHGERSVDAAATRVFADLLARRCAGEPIAYLMGTREFWSLPLTVSPAVLIPRPETELLVERCLERLPTGPSCVLDAGTGSGAIILALKFERPDLQAYACDRSAAALTVAADNSARLGLALHLVQSDWLNPIAPRPNFDLIVSNPPYVAPGDPHLEQGDLRYEPPTALVAEEGGLAAIHALISSALPRLRPGGWLLLEHGMDQAPAVQTALLAHGYDSVASYPDLSGHLRCSEGQRPH